MLPAIFHGRVFTTVPSFDRFLLYMSFMCSCVLIKTGQTKWVHLGTRIGDMGNPSGDMGNPNGDIRMGCC